jgi:hypothetical protein
MQNTCFASECSSALLHFVLSFEYIPLGLYRQINGLEFLEIVPRMESTQCINICGVLFVCSHLL